MAPKKADNNKTSNRIRFILLDADLSDGNLSELTEAITNAIKPASSTFRQLPQMPPRPPAQPALNGNSDESVADTAHDGDASEASASESDAEETPKVPKARPKLPLPAYLADLDVKGNGTPFKEFAEKNDPQKQVKRYLLAAKWLRDHGNSPTINADKVYTLFRTAGWPVGIKDWDANFRAAVGRDYMQRKGQGEYILTPVGEDALQTGD